MSDDPAVEISVVIVTYENAPEIGPCLESLFRELHGRSFQTMIIDNASGDRTRQIVNEYIPRYKGTALIANEKNIGFTAALNLGLKRSTGARILILNPDTVLHTDSLSGLCNALDRYPSAVVAPQLLNSDGSVQASCRRFPRRRDVLFEVSGLSRVFKANAYFNHWKMVDFAHDKPRQVDQPQGACLFFQRSVLEHVGFWDEQFPMFFSDVDWCKRVKLAGYEIRFQPEVQVSHHQGISIRKNRARMVLSSHRSFYHYFKKYYPGMINSVFNYGIGILLFVTGVLRAAFKVLDADET